MTIVNMAQHYDILRRIYGERDLITDYSVYQVMQYLDYQADKSLYERRMHKNITK